MRKLISFDLVKSPRLTATYVSGLSLVILATVKMHNHGKSPKLYYLEKQYHIENRILDTHPQSNTGQIGKYCGQIGESAQR